MFRGLALLDMDMEPNVAEAMRLLQKFDEETERRCAVEAKEMGFASYDEYEKALMMEDHQAHLEYERRLDEKCALLGKTREELDMEDPQRYIPDDSGWSGYHPIPFFCPHSLVDYRSEDLPDLMDYLQRHKGIRIEDLKIDQGDMSRRLDQPTLEKRWALESQRDMDNVPFWAKADPAVRHAFLDSRSPSQPVHFGHPPYRPPSPPSPAPRELTMAENGTTMTIAGNIPTSADDTHVAEALSNQSPQNHLPRVRTKPQQHPKAKNTRSKANSEIKAPRRNKRVSTAAKVQKCSTRTPAMGTRSRNTGYLYELDLGGVMIRQFNA